MKKINRNLIRCKKGILKVYYNCITFNPLNIKENINEYYFNLLMNAVEEGKLIQYNQFNNYLTFNNIMVVLNENES